MTKAERIKRLRLAPMRQTGKSGWMGSDVRLGDTEFNEHLIIIEKVFDNYDLLVEACGKAMDELRYYPCDCDSAVGENAKVDEAYFLCEQALAQNKEVEKI